MGRPKKQKLRYADVREQLKKVVNITPLELFDAKPYVDYQRQKYFAAKLNFDESDNLKHIRTVGGVGQRRIELNMKQISQPASPLPLNSTEAKTTDNESTSIQQYVKNQNKINGSLSNVLVLDDKS